MDGDVASTGQQDASAKGMRGQRSNMKVEDAGAAKQWHYALQRRQRFELPRLD